jgi:hypothetical protein
MTRLRDRPQRGDGGSAQRAFVAVPEVDLRSAVRRGLVRLAEAFLA